MHYCGGSGLTNKPRGNALRLTGHQKPCVVEFKADDIPDFQRLLACFNIHQRMIAGLSQNGDIVIARHTVIGRDILSTKCQQRPQTRAMIDKGFCLQEGVYAKFSNGYCSAQ